MSQRDPTEDIRREMVGEINANPGDRATLEAEHGKVWDTAEVVAEFEIEGFLAPFVVAIRRSDGKRGSLEFQHYPRFYYGWKEDA